MLVVYGILLEVVKKGEGEAGDGIKCYEHEKIFL